MNRPSPLSPLPSHIIHADWSLTPGKRWMGRASLQPDGRYRLHAPQPVGPLDRFLSHLKSESGLGACLLVGFDFPIGLPLAYARRAGIPDFLSALPGFGLQEWGEFYTVAETADEIRIERPFYPHRPGGTRRLHLVDRLGMADFNALRRQCELPRPERRAACPLFWTMGAQQVGKAAICGWRELLSPGLLDPALDLAVWPFHGPLAGLIQRGRVIIAETYPAEYYAEILTEQEPVAPSFRFSKRNPLSLQQCAWRILRWSEAHNLELEPVLVQTIASGFIPPSGGEDAFDAIIGLLGMLAVVLGYRPAGDPGDDEIRRIEGWILGQSTAI